MLQDKNIIVGENACLIIDEFDSVLFEDRRDA
jgi:hypothetical protein